MTKVLGFIKEMEILKQSKEVIILDGAGSFSKMELDRAIFYAQEFVLKGRMDRFLPLTDSLNKLFCLYGLGCIPEKCSINRETS